MKLIGPPIQRTPAHHDGIQERGRKQGKLHRLAIAQHMPSDRLTTVVVGDGWCSKDLRCKLALVANSERTCGVEDLKAIER